MSRIYRHPTLPQIELPQVDILTLLFNSEHCAAQDDTVVHADAANPSAKLTKASLCDTAQRIAYRLRVSYGIGKSGPNKDVVTVISYGQIAVPAVLYGVMAAGGVYSAASPSSTVADLVRQVTIGESSLIICGVEHREVASKAAREAKVPLSRVLVVESEPAVSLRTLNSLTRSNIIPKKKLQYTPVTNAQELKDSLVVILWSSGTTGLPKGVMLSHLNLVSETYILSYQTRQWAMQEVARVGLDNFKPPEFRTLAHLPISHIAGLWGYLIGPLYGGGTVYWMRRFNWKDMIANVRKYKITIFYTVPSIYLRITKSKDEVGDAFRYVEGASTGAAPMDEVLQKAANGQLGDGKTPIFIGQTWGLSETTGAVTATTKGTEPDDTGSISPILPNVELRIVDESMADVQDPERTPGELLVRAPMVTNGYWRNEKATREAFHDDWFCTGDIALMKGGKFYIVDRKKELLKYKGLQVAPAELENLLFTHPEIREAAVVGVPAPDDPGTDWPRAYVVADKKKVSAAEIAEFVKSKVAQYKQLRGGVVFVDEIPKNAVGKFLRRELRERAKAEIALERRSSRL